MSIKTLEEIWDIRKKIGEEIKNMTLKDKKIKGFWEGEECEYCSEPIEERRVELYPALLLE